MKQKKSTKNFKLSQKKQIEFDILYKTLIGKQIEIIESQNRNQIGIKGTLIYESATLFYIQTEQNKTKQIKKILKNSVVIQITYKDKSIKIDGKLLQNTLTQRIKK